MRPGFEVAAVALLLAGCSEADMRQSSEAPTATEAADSPAANTPPAPGASPVAVSLPQLAYVYQLGFVLPGDRIALVQGAHQALCDQLGPARCQLLALEQGGGEDLRSDGFLKLRVASAVARRFAAQLGEAVRESGGRAIDTRVAAEDVSRDIVDAQARIRQRELLVERLTQVLRTRQGSVGDLVEAERSVAQAQEELDKARGWLAELRGRVAMSTFELRYTATAPSADTGKFGSQLRDAAAGSASSFLIGLRALLLLAIYLLPWLLVAVPAALLVRMLLRRRADRMNEG